MDFLYTAWDPELRQAQSMDEFVRLFVKLLNKTAGNPNEALRLLRMLGDRYGLFDGENTFDDVLNELEERGLIRRRDEGRSRTGTTDKGQGRGAGSGEGTFELTAQGEKAIRREAFEEIFTSMRRDGQGGEHRTPYAADTGGEVQPETRGWHWGDAMNEVNMTRSMQNAIMRTGLDDFAMSEEDLEVHMREQVTSCATVLAIDISHSMILYGEDRITPARTIALALAEYIQTEYPKDSLEVILFGDEAFPVPIKDLPYIQVGPFHTNTKAGLDLARQILHTKRQANKQIILITDGKPSAITQGGRIYKNPFGLDPKIVNQTINSAVECRRQNIVITTFMITSDTWLRQFVDELTKANRGRAYYSSIDHLGAFVLEDFIRNRRKRV